MPQWLSHKNGGKPRGQFALGHSFYQRVYQCKDGWIYVGTTKIKAHQLAKYVAGNPEADEVALEVSFAQHDSQHWLALLLAEGIPCHPVNSALYIRPIFPGKETQKRNIICEVDNGETDEAVEGFMDFLHRADHPADIQVTFPAPSWVRIGEEQGYKGLDVAPKLGENTTEILAELGYSQQEIGELLRLNAVHEFVPLIGKDKLLFTLEEVFK